MEASALQAPAGPRTGSDGPSARCCACGPTSSSCALFRAGSEEAFRVIHDRYRQRLFAYARQMLGGSRQDAEDALQDVFLRAYGALRADDRPRRRCAPGSTASPTTAASTSCAARRPPPADVFEVSRTPLHDPLAEAERREDAAPPGRRRPPPARAAALRAAHARARRACPTPTSPTRSA